MLVCNQKVIANLRLSSCTKRFCSKSVCFFVYLVWSSMCCVVFGGAICWPTVFLVEWFFGCLMLMFLFMLVLFIKCLFVIRPFSFGSAVLGVFVCGQSAGFARDFFLFLLCPSASSSAPWHLSVCWLYIPLPLHSLRVAHPPLFSQYQYLWGSFFAPNVSIPHDHFCCWLNMAWPVFTVLWISKTICQWRGCVFIPL